MESDGRTQEHLKSSTCLNDAIAIENAYLFISLKIQPSMKAPACMQTTSSKVAILDEIGINCNYFSRRNRVISLHIKCMHKIL